MVGTCRLCLVHGELRDSHILPKWAYRMARGASNPVKLTPTVAVQTSEQITEHLLCGDCEQRIGRVEGRVADLVRPGANGEPRWLSKPGSFLDVSTGGLRVADVGDLPAEDLAYFGSSVIWRAAVSTVFPSTSLGKYAESFRLYLLDQGPFPANAACLILLTDEPIGGKQFGGIITQPKSLREATGCHSHHVLIHGIGTELYVGREWPIGVADACVIKARRVLLVPEEMIVGDWLRERLANVRRVGVLAKRRRPS